MVTGHPVKYLDDAPFYRSNDKQRYVIGGRFINLRLVSVTNIYGGVNNGHKRKT